MESGASLAAGSSTAALSRDAGEVPNGSLPSVQRVDRALSEAVRSVVASVAEELSQPVTALLLKLELMLSEAGDCDCGGPAERVDDLQTLHRNARRIVHVIEALRCYAGDGPVGAQPVRLNEIVARAHAAAGYAGVALALDPDDPLILGDGAALERFVGRVLADSRTSSDARGVRVETAAAAGDPSHVVLVVSGVGGVPDLGASGRDLLAEHSGTLDIHVSDERLVLTFPRLTLRLPGLTQIGARPQARADSRNGERAGLDRVVRALRDTFDISEQAQRITESALPLFRASAAIVWMKQPDGSLECVAVASANPVRVAIGDVLRHVGLAQRAVAEGRAHRERDGAAQRAVLAIPLIIKGEAFGAIVTEHAEPPGLVQATLDRLREFAVYIAPAMRNVHLFECARNALAHTEAASRSRDEFLALLAHELNNSLAPIVTAAVVIQRTAESGGHVQKGVDVVRRQAHHLGRLLEDLRDLSRMAQGGIQLRREPVSLVVAVEDALDAVRPLADTNGVEVAVSPAPLPVWIEADPTRLKQIIENIVGNAVKYTPAGGRVQVAVTSEDGDAVLRVRDSGIGIAPEMLPHVFDLFVRCDRARAHTRDGMGVGLTLVRHLVTLHGGRVSAESDGAGRSAEFTVRLPLALDAGASRPTRDAA